MRSRGFTLLELVIAITILAVLTVFSSSSIQQALQSKTKIQAQIDEIGRVRDALRIIQKDIQLAAHFQDFELEINQQLRKQGKSSSSPTTPPPNSPTNPPTEDPFKKIPNLAQDTTRQSPVTHFIGSDTSLHFPTFNAGIMNENQQQSDMIEVGYELRNCRKPGSQGRSLPCLVRRQSPIVDSDVTKGGGQTILLDGVTEFKLRYIGQGVQDWISKWNSKEGEGPDRNKFPELVEVSLTVDKSENDKKRKVSMQIVVPIHFLNNSKLIEDKQNQLPQQSQPAGAPPQ